MTLGMGGRYNLSATKRERQAPVWVQRSGGPRWIMIVIIISNSSHKSTIIFRYIRIIVHHHTIIFSKQRDQIIIIITSACQRERESGRDLPVNLDSPVASMLWCSVCVCVWIETFGKIAFTMSKASTAQRSSRFEEPGERRGAQEAANLFSFQHFSIRHGTNPLSQVHIPININVLCYRENPTRDLVR